MNKGLLLFPMYADLGAADGVVKKNEGIHRAFLHHGIEVHAPVFRVTGVYHGTEPVARFARNRYLRTLQLQGSVWRRLSRFTAANGYQFVWLRMPLINPFVASCVARIKTALPDSKLILEYGAYPFENELTGWASRYYRWNKVWERRAHRHADFIITYSGQADVDGVPTIPIDNGIDLSGIPLARPPRNVGERINFISVSSFKKWHAVERFIEGMSPYLKRAAGPAIHLNLVGSGPELTRVHALTHRLGLQHHVSFLGQRHGADLDAAYENNHVAIGTLGFHRIGIRNSSSLKNREYFARGLPTVLGTHDKDLPPDSPFVFYVPEGDEPLDIAAVVAFAQRAYGEPDPHGRIRAFADDRMSWNGKIRTVLEYLSGVTAGARP